MNWQSLYNRFSIILIHSEDVSLLQVMPSLDFKTAFFLYKVCAY